MEITALDVGHWPLWRNLVPTSGNCFDHLSGAWPEGPGRLLLESAVVSGATHCSDLQCSVWPPGGTSPSARCRLPAEKYSGGFLKAGLLNGDII